MICAVSLNPAPRSNNVQLCATLSCMTKIPEPNLRMFKIALYSNTKHHELPTQKWRDFHGDLRTVVTASLNPMDGDVLVVMDDTEPLRNLSEAEKESIVTFRKKSYSTTTYYNRWPLLSPFTCWPDPAKSARRYPAQPQPYSCPAPALSRLASLPPLYPLCTHATPAPQATRRCPRTRPKRRAT